jgi:hypothetical protein
MLEDDETDEFEPLEDVSEETCRHGTSPSNCEKVCECGHVCSDHPDDLECQVYGCDCAEWTEDEEEA